MSMAQYNKGGDDDDDEKNRYKIANQKVYNLTLLLSLPFATVTTHKFFYLTKDERDKIQEGNNLVGKI